MKSFSKTCIVASVLLLSGTSLSQNNYQPTFDRSDMAIMGTGDDISIFSNLSNPGILAWGHEMAYPYGPAGPLQVQSEIELANQLGFSVVTTNIDVITATAYVMYHDADLREATVRDVDDEPIVVPWFEHVTYGGGPDPTLMTWAEHPDTSEGNQGVLEVEINFGACASHYVRTYESFPIKDGDEVATSWSYDIYLPADIPDGMRIYAWVGNVPWANELSYFQTVGDSGSTLVPGEWNTLHYPITEKIDAGLFTADDLLRVGFQHWPEAEGYTATLYVDNFKLHGIGEADIVLADFEDPAVGVSEFEFVGWSCNEEFAVPTYWNCTNNPVFRDHIEDKMAMGIGFGANAVHLDDATGSGRLQRGGCFCDFCISGFRSFLEERYTGVELIAMGIDSVLTYNYRDAVHEILPDKDSYINAYWNNPDQIPLHEDYQLYHYRRMSEFIAELDSVAEDISGQPVDFHINAFNLTPRRIVGMDHINFFTVETHQNTPGEASFVYKFVDALNMSLAFTASATEWGVVKFNDAWNLAKYWIARGYAFGHHFMAPYKQWIFVDGLQTDQYTGPSDEFATVYNFVDNHHQLFDDYQAVEQYGLLYSHKSLRDRSYSLYYVANALYQINAPFGVIIAGDEWLDISFTEEDLAKYEKVFVPRNAQFDSVQSAMVENWRQQGHVFDWINTHNFETEIAPQLTPWVSLQNNPGVNLVPRMKPDDPEAPIVIHLVNSNVDVSTNSVQEQLDLVVNVDSVLLEGRDITTASYLRYNGPDEELPIEADSAGIHITVPSLQLWSILALGSEFLSTEPGAENALPGEFALAQNYPNPFNPTTTIEYTLKEPSDVELVIFDMLGRQVKTLVNGRKSAGEHKISFSAGDLFSGVYFYRLKAGNYTNMKKMLVIK